MNALLLCLALLAPARAADPSDDDGDGLGEAAGDCDDTDPTIYPGAIEACDGDDDDCDGIVDEGTSCSDDDGDGVTEDAGDCDDNNREANPNAAEVPDGVDNDCDGIIDDDTIAYDDDGDGYAEDEGDCDDADPAFNPGETDWCRDDIDQDCTGFADDDCVEDPADGCDPTLTVGLTLSTASPLAGAAVLLQAHTFADDRALAPTFNWVTQDGTVEADPADPARATWTPPAAVGSYAISVYAEDPCGYGAGATGEVTVTQAPEVEEAAPATDSGCGGDKAALLLLLAPLARRRRR